MNFQKQPYQSNLTAKVPNHRLELTAALWEIVRPRSVAWTLGS